MLVSLTPEARAKASDEALDDLLAVERDESALVWQAQAERLPVEHRADCAPQAILQVRLVAATRANVAETSPEHGWNVIGRRR